MARNRREGRLVWVWSVVLALVPLVLYPNSLGTAGWLLGPQRLLFEAVFYLVAFSFLFAEAGLQRLLRPLFVSWIFRGAIGLLFGLAAAVVHGTAVIEALLDGWYRYLPALFLQALATPFVLRGWVGRWLVEARAAARLATFEPAPGPLPVPATGVPHHRTPRPQPYLAASVEPVAASVQKVGREVTWEDAVRFVGEHAGVIKCFLVDEEGLTIASWFRDGAVEDDLWAGLSLRFWEANAGAIARAGARQVTKLEVHTEQEKVFLNRIDLFTLVAVAEPDADELVNVRLARATEMIAAYWHDRAEVLKSHLKTTGQTEEHHVSRVGVT